MRLQHSPLFRASLMVVSLALGILALLGGVAIVDGLNQTTAAAVALGQARPCGAVATPECVDSTDVVIADRYVTYGSRNSHYYHLVYTVPGGGYQRTEIASSVYDAVSVGESVPALEWRGIVFEIDGAHTDAYPNGQVVNELLGLLMLPIAVSLIAGGFFLVLTPATTDDLVRANVNQNSPPPPRNPPTGIWRSVLAWRTPLASLYGLGTTTLMLIIFVILAQSGATVGSATLAPFIYLVFQIAGMALGYSLIYRSVVRDLTQGQFAPIPVESETIIRGRYGPIGIKARYSMRDGQPSTVKITARWWRRVHVATRLDAVANPATGKIWRVLGMFDDTGNPVY